MNCCSKHIGSAGRCFGWMTRLSARRYRRKGLEKTQQTLIGQLADVGFDGASLLEVGCGAGALHHTLLERGAARAVGVDLTEKILAHAHARADEHGLAERVEYRPGDFVDMHRELPPADIAILDKVVCCYPAPSLMLGAAAACAKRAIALTYPRDRWFTRLLTALWNAAFWLMRSDFRVFVHAPALIESELRSHGLERTASRDSMMWHTQLFVAPV